MIKFKENAPTDRREDGRKDRWKDGWKDRQTLFYRSLPATSGGPTRGKWEHKSEVKKYKKLS